MRDDLGLPRRRDHQGVPVGAPPPVMAVAREQNFGSCPYGPEALVKLTTYLRGQINDFRDPAEKKGPDLLGAEKKSVLVRLMAVRLNANRTAFSVVGLMTKLCAAVRAKSLSGW